MESESRVVVVEAAGAVAGADTGTGARGIGINSVGVGGPCDAESGPLLALRRPESTQSPLSLRLRRPQLRMEEFAPLLLLLLTRGM